MRYLWIPVGIIFYLTVELLLFLPLFILGCVVVPMIRLGSSVSYSFRFRFGTSVDPNHQPTRTIIIWKNRVMDELFGNHEDGVLPVFWAGTVFGWFLRNPVTNMRFWPVVSTLPRKQKLNWFGTLNEVPRDGVRGWFVAWQGPYVGWLYQTEEWRLWLGWKVNPRDALANAPKDYRYLGLGTACQVPLKVWWNRLSYELTRDRDPRLGLVVIMGFLTMLILLAWWVR